MQKDSAQDDDEFLLASQGGINLIGNIIGKGLKFGFVALVTRLVAPSVYGVFTLGLSIVLFIQGFFSLNINRAIDYFVPQHLKESNYGKAKKTIVNAFFIGITSSLLGTTVLILVNNKVSSIFDKQGLSIILPFLAILIPLQTIFYILISSFNSMKVMKYRVLIKSIINPLMRIVGTIALVFAGLSLNALVGGYVFGFVISIVCGFIFLYYEADWISRTKSAPISNRSLLSYSSPLILVAVIYSIVGQVDYFVIGYFLESSKVAQYRVAYLLSQNLLIVLTAITPIFKPMIAENQAETKLIGKKFELATRWITVVTLPIALTLILAPDIYLSLFFTQKYTVASSAVIALCIGYLLNTSFGPDGMMLEGLGHTRLTLFNTVVLITFNCILDILLVPRYGIVGAGIATGTALAIAGGLGVIEIAYLRSVHPFSKIIIKVWVSVIPTLIGGVLIKELDIPQTVLVFLLPIILITVFSFSIWLVGGYTDEDVEVISNFSLQITRYISELLNRG